jgi:sulfide:quinone oxidoreductase
MPTRVLVLGAGFGGLEVSARLPVALGHEVDVTLIDRADAFVFGFSKLDVLFGQAELAAVRFPYARIDKPGVRFRRETIRSIDPVERRVETDGGTHDAVVLVVALGADLDVSATPGLSQANEFYSVEGAVALRETIAAFEAGRAIVGVAGPSFKCPPAPSEAALLLHDALDTRGARAKVDITLVMPFGKPIPPSPETSTALLTAFEERGIRFVPEHRVVALEGGSAALDDGTELPCDVLLGIPVHRAPQVVLDSALAVDGWIPVESATLATRFPGVYAIGDVTSVGTPKAGLFAEGAGRVVADHLIAEIRGGAEPGPYDGKGSCYIEFGEELVGRVDVDFLSGPAPTASFAPPSAAIATDKRTYAAARGERWFGG